MRESASFEARRVVDVEAGRGEVVLAASARRQIVEGREGHARRREGNRHELGELFAVDQPGLANGDGVDVGAGLQVEPWDRGVGILVAGDEAVLLELYPFLAETVVPVLSVADPAQRELRELGGPDRRLDVAAKYVEGRAGHDVPGAVLVVANIPIDDVADGVDMRRQPRRCRGAAENALAVGLEPGLEFAGHHLFGTQEIVGLPGLEHHDAADGPGPVDVRNRSADNRDRLQHFRLDPLWRGAAVAVDLEVAPRPVDDDRDAAGVLQAADVDVGRGRVAVVGCGHPRHAEEYLAGRRRLQPPKVAFADDARRRHRLRRGLFGKRRNHRDLVENDGIRRLRRCRHAHTGCRQCAGRHQRDPKSTQSSHHAPARLARSRAGSALAGYSTDGGLWLAWSGFSEPPGMTVMHGTACVLV